MLRLRGYGERLCALRPPRSDVPKMSGLRLAGKENAPGGEGNVSDEEAGRRQRSVVPAAGPSESAAAAATPAVAVARVVVVPGAGRAPAVPPAWAVAPASASAAVPGHRRGA